MYQDVCGGRDERLTQGVNMNVNRKWTTYAVTAYTHDVANDQRSAGGIHVRQVRQLKTGWQIRICQRNGRHVAYGPVTPIGEGMGEALLRLCKMTSVKARS